MATTTTTTATATATATATEKAVQVVLSEATALPEAVFWRGHNTLRIELEGVHGKNRERLVAALRSDDRVGEGAVVVLEGGSSASCMRDSTDHEAVFRQESFFHWAFGVREPDVAGTIDVATGRTTLFIPRYPAEYAVWMGPIQKPEYYCALYGVDDVKYADEMPAVLAGAEAHVLAGTNTDSGASVRTPTVDVGADGRVVADVLHETMVVLRSVKTDAEIAIMRYVCDVSSEAHIEVMRKIKPGMYEYQAEALFMHHCYFYGGHRHVGYTCICGSGTNGAVLHYGHAGAPNDKPIAPSDMCLFDMGGEYACYGADITCSFPADGTFAPHQATVYTAVLNTVKAVEAAMAPGVEWTAMHLLAERTLLESLRDAGLVAGDIDAMMDVALAPVFMPHGLGHLLGIDTHDVGGYLAGKERSSRPGLRSLRMDRPLEEGMVITVEPGCYFIDAALDAALADPATAPFLVADAIAPFRGTGGVRIEDDVLVVAGGIDNLTNVPREIADIEHVMAGGAWPRA